MTGMRLDRPLDGRRTLHVAVTNRNDGDFAIDAPGVEERRRRITPHPWTWLDQVHGAEVVSVTSPGAACGAPADAAVTAVVDAVLSVQSADCVPIVLASPEGVIGVVHAGWRGIVAGVVHRGLDALRAAGGSVPLAVVGPCIEVRCYEFGAADLDIVADAVGRSVTGSTASGAPALDVRAAVRHQLEAAGCRDIWFDPRCTRCDPQLFSHRGGDAGRQSTVAWMTSSPTP